MRWRVHIVIKPRPALQGEVSPSSKSRSIGSTAFAQYIDNWSDCTCCGRTTLYRYKPRPPVNAISRPQIGNAALLHCAARPYPPDTLSGPYNAETHRRWSSVRVRAFFGKGGGGIVARFIGQYVGEHCPRTHSAHLLIPPVCSSACATPDEGRPRSSPAR